MNEFCRYCKWFYQNGDSRASGEGECRFGPPTALPHETPSRAWPVVDIYDWCGQFTEIPK